MRVLGDACFTIFGHLHQHRRLVFVDEAPLSDFESLLSCYMPTWVLGEQRGLDTTHHGLFLLLQHLHQGRQRYSAYVVQQVTMHRI